MKIHDIKKYFFPAGYDLNNSVVLRRFHSLSEEAKEGETGGFMAPVPGKCKCFYQAELDMTVVVNTTTSPQTYQWRVWLCEEVVCSNLCWDTGGWEKGMNSVNSLGSSKTVISLRMQFAKCCGGCAGVDCNDSEGYWGSHQSTCEKEGNYGSYDKLKDIPMFARLMVVADGDSSSAFTEDEAATVTAAALDFLDRDGDDDPAAKDCAEIEGFCGGNDISV